MELIECARRINEAGSSLPDGISLEARISAGGLALTLTVSDESRGPLDVKESMLAHEVLVAPTTTAERFDAFLAATTRWLGGRSAAWLGKLYPEDAFVLRALADARLSSFADFLAVLEDPARRALYGAPAWA